MNSKLSKISKIEERPFEKLKRRNGKSFDDDTIRNWYRAYAYVQDKLKDVIVRPDSNKTVKVIIEIDDYKELMLSVVRFAAIALHYPNYEEYDEYGNLSGKNSSTIKIVTHDSNIDEELKDEKYLNNLLKYCQYKKNGKGYYPSTENLIPIDLAIDIVENINDADRKDAIIMTYEDVKEFLSSKSEGEIYGIDARLAVLSSRVYDLGADIDNLPYEDIHDAGRYNRALNVFEHTLLTKEIKPMVTEGWENNQVDVKNGLSNIFCADRFRSINEGMQELFVNERNKYCKKCEKNIHRDCPKVGGKCNSNEITETTCWEKNDLKLAVSEHTRWVVEKLILGYRPMNTKEHSRYESLLGSQRKAYAKLLKGDPLVLYNTFPKDYENSGIDPTHLNLCTFKELRRIDPDNRKYDSFLMLAIPMILKKLDGE